MIASNLGQIIGRLMLGEPLEFTPAKPEAVPSAPRSPRGRRRAQCLALVGERGEVVCADVVAALGITGGHATVLLHQLWREGQLQRSGGRHNYRYRLP